MAALQDDASVWEDGGRRVARLSRDWEIWGPNGGYLAAIALRGAGRVVPRNHRPVSFSCQYLAVGDFDLVEVEAEPAKAGRSAWCVNVRLVQGGKTLLQAQVWTTDRTEGPATAEAVRPDVEGPAHLKSYAELLPPEAPKHRFWENLEGRPVSWPGYQTPDPQGAVSRAWHRFRNFDAGGDPFVDGGRPLVLIDTLLWPTHARALAEPPSYIAPSLDLTVWFHQPALAAEWLLLDSHADTAGGGLVAGGARVWTEDGRLVATGGGHMLVTPLKR